MKKILKLILEFFIIVNLYQGLFGQVSFNFIKDQDINYPLKDNYLIKSVKFTNRFKCLNDCSKLINCLTVIFNKKDSVCDLYSFMAQVQYLVCSSVSSVYLLSNGINIY